MAFFIASLDDVEGIDSLRWDDQKRIKSYVEGGASGGSTVATTIADKQCSIEVSQTSRATCRHCSQKILKGMVGIFLCILKLCETLFLLSIFLVIVILNTSNEG